MPVENLSAPNASLPSLKDPFQQLLQHLASATAQRGDPNSLAQIFCQLTRQFFRASGAYCWKLALPNELIGLSADGAGAENFRKTVIKTTSRAPVVEAILSRKAVCTNSIQPDHYPPDLRIAGRSAMAVPLIVSGEVVGALTFVHDEPGFFDDELAAKATILSATLANSIALSDLSRDAREERQRAESLVAATLDIHSSLRLPDFARKFAQRACQIAGAQTALLALSRHSKLEIVVLQDPSRPNCEQATLQQLTRALNARHKRLSAKIAYLPAADVIDSELAQKLNWQDVVTVPLTGAGEEPIGLLCLANCASVPDASQRKLLQVITVQASAALENSRLFTRIEQANRHWIELFDAIGDFIVVHDEGNSVLRVNRSLADFIGVRPSDLIGIGMRALMSMAANGATQSCPFCRAGQDGSDEYMHPVLEHTYLVSTSRIHSAVSDGLHTIHVLKDITDRREAERRYRELFENIQEGLFFSTVEGRFVEVNDTLVRMLGYSSRDELLQLDTNRDLCIDPSVREQFVRAITDHGSVRNFEETLRRKDGSLVYTLQNAFAVRDSQGNIVQYRGLMLDITESKTYQAALQRERDFSSKILNNTQSMILVADTAGLVSYANNRCFANGDLRESDLIGRPLVDLVPTSRRHVMADALRSTLDGRQIDNLELPVMFGTATLGQFSVNLSPMRDEQGNVTSIVVVMTDITDAAILQAKLVHTEKMAAVGQLVSGVAHEVNNPLTAILGFADLLLEQPDVPESARKDLNVILQEAQRTKQIVQNLLSFARQMPPQRGYIQVNAILQRTLSLRSYDLANHGVQVQMTVDPDMPELIGDAQQIQQVFLNILNNAYDAICEVERPGRIEIRTAHTSDAAEISFRDNGPGIGNVDRIFDPFFTTKEVGKGTGLGLSICYGIVNERGGEIVCSNNSGAEGATFVVRLPLAKSARPVLATGDTEIPVAPEAGARNRMVGNSQ
jgi:PAS domain S-box-containing protein